PDSSLPSHGTPPASAPAGPRRPPTGRGPPDRPPRGAPAATRFRRPERLIEVGENVVDLLDPHAEPNRLRAHPGLLLLLHRHLPMRRRRRMARQRLGVPQIDQPHEQLERVVESLARLEPPLDPKRQQRTGPPPQI